MSGRPLVLVELYPGALFPQGDGGNLLALDWRAKRRGIETAVRRVALGEPVPIADLYVIGGGEDEDEAIIARRLRADGTLARAVSDGAVVFGVGAGYQILGESFEDLDGALAPGVGLLEVRMTRGAFVDRRVVTRPNRELGLPALSGYESHRGRAMLGPAAVPLAELEIGTGNGGNAPRTAATDGAVQGHVVGTWLHGPVLPRNPELADLLLEWAAGKALEPLDDRESRFAELVRAERIAEARRYRREGAVS
jgi:lipid II isoglutaminyl synthase (glutamine-hydrolysing)